MKNNQFNKLAALLLILFIIALGIGLISKAYLWFFYPGLVYEDNLVQFNTHTAVISLVFQLFLYAVHIGCAFWLYGEAKNKSSNKWVWVSLGLFSGVFSVILWYLKLIYEELVEEKT